MSGILSVVVPVAGEGEAAVPDLEFGNAVGELREVPVVYDSPDDASVALAASYSTDFVHNAAIESSRVFESSVELATTAHQLHVSEIPTTADDRTGADCKVRLRELIPHHLRLHVDAFGPLVRGAVPARQTATP
jgi:hypothetical protein